MKTLYLHIGTPKTGTTAIQAFCKANQEVLGRKGYYYPVMPYIYPGIGRNRNAAFLQCTICKDGVRQDAEEEQRALEGLDIVRGYFETYDNVILSDEGLWVASYEKRKTLWQDLKEYSGRHQFNVKIIVYLRRQDTFMDSRWRQRVKGSGHRRSRIDISWEDYINNLPEAVQLDYFTALERISAVFGKENVIVRRFDRKYFPDGMVQADFLKAVGLEMTDEYMITQPSANESLCGNICEIKRLVNSLSDLTESEYTFLRSALLSINAYSGEAYSSTMFSAREAEEFLAQYRQGNQKVAEEYLGETGRELFDTDFGNLSKWEKDNPYMMDDIIRFIAVTNAGMIRKMDDEKRALKKEMEKELNELKYKLKHPLRTSAKIILKKFKAATALVLVSMLCLTGCEKESGEDQINIGYFNNVTHAQALYMKATGSLESSLSGDVKINWTAFNAGPAEVEALFSGDIDIGYIGPVPAITANVKSKGDITILSGASKAGAVLVKSPGSDIESVSDLDGKTVAVPQIGNTQHLCLLKLLSDNQLAPVDKGGTVEVTAVENADVMNMMDQGNIDAALVPEPWGTTLEHNGAKIVLDYDEVYQNGDYPVAVVVVRNEFMEEHPDITDTFLKEHETTTDYIIQNVDEASVVVNEEINAATGKSLDKEILAGAFKKLSFSTDVNEEAIRDFADISLEQGFIAEDYTEIFSER